MTSKGTSHMPTSVRRRAPFLIALTAVAALSAGCKHLEDETRVAAWSLTDATQRHPIMVSQRPAHLSVRVPRGSQSLSPAQRAELLEFAQHFQATDAGNSRLVISAPGGAGNEAAAMHAVQEIRALLEDRGFSASSISVEAYHAERSQEPPVRVSYLRYVAEGPQCGNWSTNLAREPNNLPYPNFGCTTQHNLAAQIANPADLLGPRTMTPRSAERRDTVWEKYTKGNATNSSKGEDERISTKGN